MRSVALNGLIITVGLDSDQVECVMGPAGPLTAPVSWPCTRSTRERNPHPLLSCPHAFLLPTPAWLYLHRSLATNIPHALRLTLHPGPIHHKRHGRTGAEPNNPTTTVGILGTRDTRGNNIMCSPAIRSWDPSRFEVVRGGGRGVQGRGSRRNVHRAAHASK